MNTDKHKFRPRLWPLIKRFGIIGGIWRHHWCGRYGHVWHWLPNSAVTFKNAHGPSGVLHASAMAKARCPVCEMVRQLQINVTIFPDGKAMVTVPEISAIKIFQPDTGGQ